MCTSVNKTRLAHLTHYVTPYYEAKDLLHGIDHAYRLIDAAREIGTAESMTFDDEIMVYGGLFHGLAAQHAAEIGAFFGPEESALAGIVLDAAIASLGRSECRTTEEKLLHDAHVVEGGDLYFFIKPLLTGTYVRQPLEETLSFIDGMLESEPQLYFEYSRMRLTQFRQEASALQARLRAQLSSQAGTTDGDGT